MKHYRSKASLERSIMILMYWLLRLYLDPEDWKTRASVRSLLCAHGLEPSERAAEALLRSGPERRLPVDIDYRHLGYDRQEGNKQIARVLSAIERGASTSREAAVLTGLSVKRVSHYLSLLFQSGLVRREAGGTTFNGGRTWFRYYVTVADMNRRLSA